MTEISVPAPMERRTELSTTRVRRRYAAERRYRLYGALSICIAIAMLGLLLFSIISNGYSAFLRTEIGLDIKFDAAEIDPQGTRDPAVLSNADYAKLIRNALQ